MGLYVDPATPGRERPGLFVELLGQPATLKQQQLENQASYILGWLCDRSQILGRALAACFLSDHPSVTESSFIGARTQLKLPTGLRPDISIDGSDRSFQLLIEVKTTSSFSIDPETGDLQDERYRREWATMPGDDEAHVRAVGTLTAKADPVTLALPDKVDVTALRARDLAWSDVEALLRTLNEEGELEPEVRLIADSFREAIALHLAWVPLDAEGVPRFLGEAMGPAKELARSLALHVGTQEDGGKAAADFVNFYVRYDDPTGSPVVLRVIAAAAGGVLCPAGAPHTLLVAVGRDDSALLHGAERARATEAGFVTKKSAKYRLTYHGWAFESAVARDPADLAHEVLARLQAAGFA